ncbi:MAG: hypothetical protein KIT31_32790 [Deltaproteobacteria bacterium]|nr:hypothetical protein [Deltaproteobacteria bacterium]
MRKALALLCMLVACGGKKDEPPAGPGTGSAPKAPAPPADAAPPADWTAACAEALRAAGELTPVRRIQRILDGCQPCGDWTPILAWNSDKGPTRAQLETAMVGCKAFCDTAAKRQFLTKFDEMHGKPGRLPWKVLGEACKGDVSGLPDARYVSAPYFALDRIARAAGADARLAPLLAGITVPLPAVSVTGNGFDLPKSPTTNPHAGPVHVSVSATQIQVGVLAHATLGKDGVVVHAPGESYPGRVVKPIELPAAIDALAPAAPIALIGPSGVKAVRLLETVATLGGKRQLRLAVAASGAPVGWVLAGTIPIDLIPAFRREVPSAHTTQLVLTDKPDAAIAEAKKKSGTLGDVTIAIAPAASVTDLAKLLGALGYFDVQTVALTAAK